MYKILVTGSSGQLGSEIRDLAPNYPQEFFFTNKDELDITDSKKLNEFIESKNINAIINTAAYTLVDMAQENENLAEQINHAALKNLSQICAKRKIKLLHISTDYVFSGEHYKPYTELDTPNPKSVYGLTKLKGERAILESNLPNSAIIRTAWVYSKYKSNFVKTILRVAREKEQKNENLRVVYDQVGSPTYAKDLAKALLDILPLLNCQKPEIFHYSNHGAISWYDFAKEIVKMAKINVKLKPILSHQYPTKAPRPHYSVLDKSKIINTFGIEIPYWKDSLKICLG